MEKKNILFKVLSQLRWEILHISKNPLIFTTIPFEQTQIMDPLFVNFRWNKKLQKYINAPL